MSDVQTAMAACLPPGAPGWLLSLRCADPDGSCFDADELLGALELVGWRAVVFPLAEPDSYREAKDRTLAPAVHRVLAFADDRRLPVIVQADVQPLFKPLAA